MYQAYNVYKPAREKIMAIKPFNYQQAFSSIDFRQHPELYQVGRGEQGVLLVEPYKSEILPYWRYKDEASAIESARKIYQLFEFYRQQARKFIQMGYTRARRYANYKGGKKYAKEGHLNSRGNDPVKAAAAAVFKQWWDKLRQDEDYLQRKKKHQSHWG